MPISTLSKPPNLRVGVHGHLLWLSVSLLVGWAMARYYELILLDLRVATDVQDHVEYLVRVRTDAYAWPANPGFHWLTWLLSGFSRDGARLLQAAPYALGLSWGASVYAAIRAARGIGLLGQERATASAKWTAVAAAVAACSLFSPPVRLLLASPNNYLGLLPPNVYHNSTLIVALPFAIAAFGLGVRQLRGDLRFGHDALLGLMLVAGALGKPSYAFAFVPAYGVLRLLQSRRLGAGRVLGGLVVALLPVLLLILGQARWIALHPEVSFHGESHIAFAFPAGWNMLLFLPNITALESTVLGLGSFALPLVAYAVRPAWLRQPCHQLAVLSTVFGFAQFMLVYEAGSRAGHGNFMWQVMAANHVLYWMVTLEVLRSQPATKSDWVRQVLLLSAVGLSIVSGLLYLSAIASTGTYQ